MALWRAPRLHSDAVQHSLRSEEVGHDYAHRPEPAPPRVRVFPQGTSRNPASPSFSQRRTEVARFPQAEPDIAALAVLVTQGLGQMAEDFPAPPVPADELKARLDAYNAARGGLRRSRLGVTRAARRQGPGARAFGRGHEGRPAVRRGRGARPAGETQPVGLGQPARWILARAPR